MPIKVHNPKTVSLAGAYSLGTEVPAGARLLYVSGQVGVNAKGKVQDGIEKQTASLITVNVCGTTAPAPSVRWPTSELPICPSGKPTLAPLALSSAWG